MTPTIGGLHHVTAIARDPQQNLDFYAGLLGLRLVKITINYDDPGTYHLYYGDGIGSPGTILTFFPWPDALPGRPGIGQTRVTSLSIPETSVGYWVERFVERNLAFEGPKTRFGERVLMFADPDGMQLELVAHAGAEMRAGWQGGPVPAEHALRGIHSVTLTESSQERTAELLTQTLGFRQVRAEGERIRYEVGGGGAGAIVDVIAEPGAGRGRIAAGSVHHIAWRTPGDAEQAAWRDTLQGLVANVSPVMDRQYFHSIYFREPGGVLFEIATDPPGFTADGETAETLGTGLRLPSWLEPQRAEIARALPPLRLPETETEAMKAEGTT